MMLERQLQRCFGSREILSTMRLLLRPPSTVFSRWKSVESQAQSTNKSIKFGHSRNCLFTFIRHVTRSYSTKRQPHDGKKHKDLYAIMGVSPHATQVQIKEAYYRLSMKYHPDQNRESEDAHTKFTELTEAYSVLGQYDLRRKYDKGMLHQYPRQPSHTHSEHTGHHSTPHASRSTMHGKRSKFDFDEFYRAHYGEALRREQEARRSRAAARERAKLYSISNSWQQVLIIGVCVSVLLVGMYGYSSVGYSMQQRTNRTTTSSHNDP